MSPVDGEGPWLAVVTPAQILIFTIQMSDKSFEYWLSSVGGEILIITNQMSNKSFELNCQAGLEGIFFFNIFIVSHKKICNIFINKQKKVYCNIFILESEKNSSNSMGSRIWRHLWSLDSIWISIFTQRGHQVNATHKTSYNLLM